ncbi:MAG: sigma factor-like helix-turn-helix DNA-binding protein [Patescibacteria group bacterium]
MNNIMRDRIAAEVKRLQKEKLDFPLEWLDEIFRRLKPNEQQVLKLAYGTEVILSNAEVAKISTLNVTATRIGQIKKNALKKFAPAIAVRLHDEKKKKGKS